MHELAWNSMVNELSLSGNAVNATTQEFYGGNWHTQVVCTCVSYGCGRKNFTNEFGQHQPGKLVSTTTKRKHEQKDEQSGLDRRNPSLQANQTPRGPRKTSPEPMAPAEDLPAAQRREKGMDIQATGDAEPSVAGYRQSIYALLCILATWLHLSAGLSREATNMVLKICGIVIAMALRLSALLHDPPPNDQSVKKGSLANSSSPSAVAESLKKSLPTDVRTAITALSIEPTIDRAVCCPRCLARYKLENLPEKCYWREIRGHAHATSRFGQHALLEMVPFWLSQPGTEDAIAKSYTHQRSPGPQMRSIWDSPAWKSLGNFTTTEGNLTFTFYIDWFNPLTNKIAGKSVSCGAIMFFCLNLPHELQHLPENTFFAGITPPPKEPNVTAITNLLDPIIERFDYLYRVGKSFRTFNHPEGRLIRAAILVAIGDLLAMRKAMGFAGVGSNRHFCSFCTLHKDNIDELDITKLTPRDDVEVKIAAQESHDAPTVKKKIEIFKKHGVRWTSLHLLDYYRSPVKHTMLGLMHNWIEGILQHHARIFWGIGLTTVNAEKELAKVAFKERNAPPESEETVQAADSMALDDELESLQSQAVPPHLSRSTSMEIDSPSSLYSPSTPRSDASDSEHGTDTEETEKAQDWDAGNDDDDIDDLTSGPISKVFSDDEMEFLHQGLSDAVVPSYLARLPTNFGDASHGKLKADQWLIGFSVFFPLILPELWAANGAKRKLDLLDNFAHLVTCTNIVCSSSVSNEDADRYTEHYVEYRRSARDLFSRSSSRPNHHYAMHNGPHMKFYGPLMPLSEYPYETHNGTLQKIKTNHHLWELDLTMLRNICRRGRLQAIFKEKPLLGVNELFSSAMDLFRTASGTGATSEGLEVHLQSTEAETALFNGSGTPLPEHIYNKLLSYLATKEPESIYRHRSAVPHPAGANVLTNYAQHQSHFIWKTRPYSIYSKHIGNSSISYVGDDGEVNAGFIQSIFTQVLQRATRTFFVVHPHLPLSPADNALNPYSRYPGMLAAVVYDTYQPEQAQIIIESDRIIGHVAFRRRPSGTFGIDHPTLILCFWVEVGEGGELGPRARLGFDASETTLRQRGRGRTRALTWARVDSQDAPWGEVVATGPRGGAAGREGSSIPFAPTQTGVFVGINLSVKKGELVGILGRVGAGKTSLLSAIVGEMTRREGEVIVRGTIAYPPQNPRILSATVRENILFSDEYDEVFYNLVLEAMCFCRWSFGSVLMGMVRARACPLELCQVAGAVRPRGRLTALSIVAGDEYEAETMRETCGQESYRASESPATLQRTKTDPNERNDDKDFPIHGLQELLNVRRNLTSDIGDVLGSTTHPRERRCQDTNL
ncbi:hypothetical protein DFP72DRAFT_862125 [Ephemerocybe angulata]|uniref:ABC transporter domain-containing protein n=1 Tax=Ephemerocybe angulata TaxID=980116 RepID=A0A8H6H8W0_9AGAR|nr:hypothetical protein DFP72DRAFT_862125 [Tulosesus angulatus]